MDRAGLGPGASLRACYEEAGDEIERRFKHVGQCATVSSVGARGRWSCGTHAWIRADRFLTRDAGFYRKCFTRLKIVDPSTS